MSKRKRNNRRRNRSRIETVVIMVPIIAGVSVLIMGLAMVINGFISGWDAGKDDKPPIIQITEKMHRKKVEPIESAAEQFPDMGIQEDYIPVNEFSRPQIPLEDVDKIVIHYTANPGATAQANRDYFAGLAESHLTYASSHFVVGMEGEIIQCMPLNEVAYASKEANYYSISIECCHPDETGEFATPTYNQCVKLVARLCKYYKLDPEKDVIRHYDVTEKLCPLFYVENPDEWEMFVGYVKKEYDNLP